MMTSNQTTMLKFSLSPNWSVANLKTFEECVHVVLDNKLTPIADSNLIEDFVDSKNTLYLVPLDSGNPPACELEIISTAVNHSIKTIHIVSSCSLLEIYSQNQYLRTEKGNFIDEFEGISSHKSTIVVPTASKHISLKFTKNADLWIFGLQIILEECSPNAAMINLDNVNELLSSVTLTDRAQRCKRFIEANQKTQPPSMASIMSMISQGQQSKLRSEPAEIDTLKGIQSYMDHRFRIFEKHITEKIDQQSQKLDDILALLRANK